MDRRIWLGITFSFAVTMVTFGSAVAKTQCRRPAPATILGIPASSIGHVSWIETAFSGRRQQWLGTAEGLSDGELYLLDCRGHVIARTGVGAVKKLAEYPSDQIGRPVVMAIVQGSGTGYLEEDAILVTTEHTHSYLYWNGRDMTHLDTDLRLIWRHQAYVFAAGWPGSQMKTFRKYFRFSRNRDGTKIFVSGAYLRTYPPPAQTEQRHMKNWFVPIDGHIAVVLPPEVYCWVPRIHKFSSCETLSTAAPPIATH